MLKTIYSKKVVASVLIATSFLSLVPSSFAVATTGVSKTATQANVVI
jgi:hypothetical protein